MNKDSSKRYFIITVTISLFLLITMAVVVIFVDPYFHFHKPFKNVPYDYDLDFDIYQRDGVMRHFEFDSAVIGSSMSNHLSPGILDAHFGTTTIKCPISSASTKDLCEMLSALFKYNPDVKTVYYSLDAFALLDDPYVLNREVPDYLCDNNIFNDTKYLFDKNVIFDAIPMLYGNKRERISSFDEVGAFYKWVDYGRIPAMGALEMNLSDRFVKCDINENTDISTPIVNVDENLLPLIEAHPDTEFKIYLSPYSMLYWYKTIEKNDFSAYIKGIRYALEKITKCDNVTVFFFWDCPISKDLYRYSDTMHWDPQAGNYICESFINGTRTLSYEEIDDRLDDFMEYLASFDFGVYNGDIYSFQLDNSLSAFLKKTEDKKYTKYVLINSQLGKISDKNLNILKKYGYIADELGKGESYAAVVEGTDLLCYNCSDKPGTWETEYKDNKLTFVTAGNDASASITMNGYEYCPKEDDFNIVVYDNETGMIVDSVGYKEETGKFTHY